MNDVFSQTVIRSGKTLGVVLKKSPFPYMIDLLQNAFRFIDWLFLCKSVEGKFDKIDAVGDP